MAVTIEWLSFRAGWGYFASTRPLENNDLDQQSLWCGLDIRPVAKHQVTLDVNVNLDGPYGVASGEPKPTWGVVLGARQAL